MKKIILLASILLATVTFSQRVEEGETQLNAGIYLNNGGGTPLYVGLDYGVHPDWTVGGQVSYSGDSNTLDSYGGMKIKNKYTFIGISANGNYHFNTILDIPNKFDVYAGGGLGITYFTNKTTVENIPDALKDAHKDTTNSGNDGINFLIQIGGRYYFTDNLGINLELGVMSSSPHKIGVSYKF